MSDTVEPGFGSLAVRLITQPEIARFNELLDQHHYLGHHLVGRVLRYVACEDDEWVVLLGFGSPARSLRPREDFIGWSEQAKSRRLRFVSSKQRSCVLGDRRRKNLASAVLSRTLRRVSEDAKAACGDQCTWSRPSPTRLPNAAPATGPRTFCSSDRPLATGARTARGSVTTS